MANLPSVKDVKMFSADRTYIKELQVRSLGKKII